MNDAERDAWLREALRHAPDSDALPPSGVSDAILLKARAAARAAGPSVQRRVAADARAHPLAAFWSWLARPPVAAGFASVMAATLVGLMWWDRPMDEGMVRPPAMASDRAPAAASPTSPGAVSEVSSPLASTPSAAAAPPTTPAEAPTTSAAATAPAPRATRPPEPTMTQAQHAAMANQPTTPAPFADAAPANDAEKNAADERAVVRRQRSAPAPAGAAEAQLAQPAATPAERSADLLAKEQAPQAAKKSEAATPFPSGELKREVPSTRKPSDAAAANAASEKDVADSRSRAANEIERATDKVEGAAVPPTAPRAAPPAVTGATAAAPPAPSTPAFRAESKRSQAEPPPRADSATRADAAARAIAASRAVAPSRVLAAVAAEPERWLRQTAAGDAVALDAGWRGWLAELDLATTGRWQPLDAAPSPADETAARDGSTSLRLVNAGRLAAIVRLDGNRVQVDAAPGTGNDRWQATLVPAGAERLRSTARRLSP